MKPDGPPRGLAPPPLPIDEIIPAVADSLERERNAVVVAAPGAGKTTRLAPALLDASFLRGRNIIALQPRRVAARAAAARIADERKWRLGEEVGYHIRFDRRFSARTRLRFLTEGILTRRLVSDPFLEDIGLVILDEFHERSIHVDLALAMLREIQRTVREDLRIVVMSATLDPGSVGEFLGNTSLTTSAPVFESRGRVFPVEIAHLERPDSRAIWDQAADAIRAGLARPADSGGAGPGHILVFLPGMEEIRRTASLVHDAAARAGFETHVLHSSVSAEAQDQALRPSARRKLILATNIAETSITIDGVTSVIDSGWARQPMRDARLGIDRLELTRISRASADQRAGRAGRTAPGRALRLWTRAEDIQLETRDTPEIMRIDLAPTALALKAFGSDPASFGWFEPPAPDTLAAAERELWLLGATDARGAITKSGRAIAEIPAHPRLARLALAGAELGCPRAAASIAALLSERDAWADAPGDRRKQAQWESPSDLLDRLHVFEGGSAGSIGFNPAGLRRIERVRDEISRAAGLHPDKELKNEAARDTAALKALFLAWPDRLALRKEGDPSRGVMVGGRAVVLEPACAVRKGRLFLAIDAREAPDGEARVALASVVQPEWIEALRPDLLRRETITTFDERRGKAMTLRRELFLDLTIREEIAPAAADPEAQAAALADHILKSTPGGAIAFLKSDPDTAEWLARVALLRRTMPELALPDWSESELAAAIREAMRGRRSVAEADPALARRLLEGAFTHAQRQAIQTHAPERFQAPSGSSIRLRYSEAEGREGPILAVRLQEMFGLAETPRVAAGRAPVTLQLLGPNHRPVQTTSDLKNFWATTYQEIRKELRARYPRHPWPEDPWTARPVSVGGRRRS